MRSSMVPFLDPRKKLLKVETCQSNLKGVWNIQNFPLKMPNIGQNLPEKCILSTFICIFWANWWPKWESGFMHSPWYNKDNHYGGRAGDSVCIQETSRFWIQTGELAKMRYMSVVVYFSRCYFERNEWQTKSRWLHSYNVEGYISPVYMCITCR